MAPSPEEIADGGGASSSIQNQPPTDRELDDEFLLNQTRVWLEKVLDKEFDQDVNLSDLLADGQILFDVYKELRRMLISVNHPSQHKFPEKESVPSTKIAEKFPYTKVADFLQVCKVLGLRDEDLFPTSDVVHKNNTLKVCTCLRSLSRNAISWKLEIPDFDSVAVTQRNRSELGQLKIEDPDEGDIEKTSSSSQVHGSAVGDSYELVENLTNYDQENNFPSQSIVLDEMQATEESAEYDDTSSRTSGKPEVGKFVSVQSDSEQLKIEDPDEYIIAEASSPSQVLESADDTSADNENESNGDECKPPWKLLKLIAGGAGALVAVGFMLYFLRPRKKGTREKNFILPNPTRSAATEKRDEQELGCCISKFYPAYKLKF